MRIIGGTARGRRLYAPKGQHTRPTQDRVREAIFNVLAAHVPGAAVLDAFAGSGAMGLEALSRGAVMACLVENDAGALQVLRRNVADAALPGAHVIAGNIFKLIPRFTERFQLIFLDPPYNSGLLEQALAAIMQADILEQDGLIVVETTVQNSEFTVLSGLTVAKSSSYGTTAIYYLRKTAQ